MVSPERATTRALCPFSERYLRDPHPEQQRLRREVPVFYDGDLELWVVSRYDDVRHVLTDGSTFSNVDALTRVLPGSGSASTILQDLPIVPVFTAGPAAHARVRRAVGAAFPTTPRSVSAHESMVRHIVRTLVDRLARLAEPDLVPDFAAELPVRVMLTLMGAPERDAARVRQWAERQVMFLWGPADDDQQLATAREMHDFARYCQALVADRMREPRADVTSALVHYRDRDGAALSQRELVGILSNLLIAGIVTVPRALGTATHELLANDRWATLVARPQLIPHAVEELLRYGPPVIGWLRTATRAVRLGDVEIEAGDRLLALLGSANRDEDRFEAAACLAIDRTDRPSHLSFGVGRHHCVGSALARLQLRLALEALVDRFPNMRLQAGFQPRYDASIALRGLRALPVTF